MKATDDRSRRRFLNTGSILGLAAAFSPLTIAEAFTNSDSKTNQMENIMTRTSADARRGFQSGSQTQISPKDTES